MANIIDSLNSKTDSLVKLAKIIGHPDLILEIGNLKEALGHLKKDYSKIQDENRELKAQRQEDVYRISYIFRKPSCRL